jgi:hypothetical protein
MITLGVADVNRARKFYEAIGWRASSASTEQTTFFRVSGFMFGLYSIDALTAEANVKPGRGGFGGMCFTCSARSATEVDTALKLATGAGGTVLRPAQQQPWGGYSGMFADVDGYVWEIAWNPDPNHMQSSDGTQKAPSFL